MNLNRVSSAFPFRDLRKFLERIRSPRAHHHKTKARMIFAGPRDHPNSLSRMLLAAETAHPQDKIAVFVAGDCA